MLTQIEIEKLPSYHWGKTAGREEGIEQGVTKGIFLERHRLAKQLLSVMDDQTIITMTGLSLAEVEQLKRQTEDQEPGT